MPIAKPLGQRAGAGTLRQTGILPDQEIQALFAVGRAGLAAAARCRPGPAGEPRPAARRQGLARARQLPARARPHRRRQARPAEAARDRPDRRRGAGNRLRLHRAAAGKPRPARRHLGLGQSEELDRPARHLHPRHHRPRPGVRQDPGRLSRPALSRGQPAHLPDRRAHRLAPVADPLPHRQCAAVGEPSSATCTAPRRWSPPSRPTFRAAASRCRSTSTGDEGGLVGYRGKHHTGVVDVDKRAAHEVLDFWEPLYNRGAGRTGPRSRRVLHPRLARRRCTCRRSTPPR